ncbi:MAG: hypothetical protein F9K31_03705 [Dokdonella sp.]|nr:MAG: hypothetical protein F9K31_03705 [Dokdonella sp.]
MKALGTDAAPAEPFTANPQAVIKRFRLSDVERKALLDRDLKAIRQLTGLSGAFRVTHSTIKAYAD